MKQTENTRIVRAESRENNANYFVSGAIFGTLLGIVSTLAYKYFRGILKQPRLTSKAVLSDIRNLDTQEKRALFIATENLHAGVAERHLDNREHKLILHAGYRNFRESWARDFGFAAYGLLALQAHQPIRDTLEAFFWYQTPQGQLPVKLQSMHMVSRFFHSLFGREQSLDAHLTPKYITGHRSVSLDGQALLVIAACNYILHTDDRAFALDIWESLQLSLKWLQMHTQPHSALLYQKAYADWADSVAREGTVLYSNVVYWKALRQMADLAAHLGYDGDVVFYGQIAENLKGDLVQQLWVPDAGYFATSKELENLSSAGNLLAVAWGLADEAQSNSILDLIQAVHMADPVPTQAAYPSYARSQISLENRLGGLSHYHTKGAWLWIGAWHVIALCRVGRLSEAQRLLGRISAVITRDQQVHEVYGLDGQPLSSFWYTSEAPLTWNAGMVIYTFQELDAQLKS